MKLLPTLFVLSSLLLFISPSQALEVNIISDVPSIDINIAGNKVKIIREQNTEAKITGEFAKTSRPCPAFCAQSMSAAEGVKTIGERELIFFMANELNNETGLLVDARTEDWFLKETIPGSINIPYTQLNPLYGADEFSMDDALTLFGAEKEEFGAEKEASSETDKTNWDFFDAKKLVIWCNGPWCGQSHAAIQGLIELGYPEEKLFYYRGGMQLWKIFGFNTIKP